MIQPSRLQPSYYSADGAHGANKDRWMISHMDVVTILLILFVAMTAQSQQAGPVNRIPVLLQRGWNMLPAQHFSLIVASGSSPEISQQTADQQAQAHLRAAGLDVHRDHRGIVISLPQSILFAQGQDAVNSGALLQIASIAQFLNGVPNRVALVGYADATPIHTERFHNNWDLAAARSTRLLEVFTQVHGLDESRFVVESHGANEPVAGNKTPEARAENRRVEVVILD